MILLFLLSVLILPGSIYSLTIKIGCVARPGSPWEKSLEKLGGEWGKITGGKVKFEIFPGERIGSEYDMVQEMRNGKLDGAAFFSRGMPRICTDVYLFNIPLLTNSREEHDYVFNKMKPVFEKRIEEQGFKVITWGLSGWLKFFSKHPVFYPGDLQKHKLSLITWNPEIEQVWRNSGLRIVPTDFKDLKMALQSGMVDAFFLSPLVAETGGYFTLAPNMCTQTVAPEYWSIVLTRETWGKIPHRHKKQMEETAHQLSKDLYEEILELEKKAVERMEEQDLLINKLPADALEKWRAAIGKGLAGLIGKVYSKEIFDRMKQYIKEYREKHSPRHR